MTVRHDFLIEGVLWCFNTI